MTKTTLRQWLLAGVSALTLAASFAPAVAAPVDPNTARGDDGDIAGWRRRVPGRWDPRNYDNNRYRTGRPSGRHDWAEFRRLQNRWQSSERRLEDRLFRRGRYSSDDRELRAKFDENTAWWHRWASDNWTWAQRNYRYESQWREFINNLEDSHREFLYNLERYIENERDRRYGGRGRYDDRYDRDRDWDRDDRDDRDWERERERRRRERRRDRDRR
jgi:hypothetical protein